MHSIMALSLDQIRVEVCAAAKSLSISSAVKNSTILGSALIRSIAVGERATIHCFSQYFKKALRVIIYALAVWIEIFFVEVLCK